AWACTADPENSSLMAPRWRSRWLWCCCFRMLLALPGGKSMRRFFCKRGGAGSQRGAAAIEFALVFVIFFAIFYATVSYSLFFLLQAAFNHAASEGARAAVSVDPLAYDNTNDYLNGGVAPVVRET